MLWSFQHCYTVLCLIARENWVFFNNFKKPNEKYWLIAPLLCSFASFTKFLFLWQNCFESCWNRKQLCEVQPPLPPRLELSFKLFRTSPSYTHAFCRRLCPFPFTNCSPCTFLHLLLGYFLWGGQRQHEVMLRWGRESCCFLMQKTGGGKGGSTRTKPGVQRVGELSLTKNCSRLLPICYWAVATSLVSSARLVQNEGFSFLGKL